MKECYAFPWWERPWLITDRGVGVYGCLTRPSWSWMTCADDFMVRWISRQHGNVQAEVYTIKLWEMFFKWIVRLGTACPVVYV